jgi:hypothetical protein
MPAERITAGLQRDDALRIYRATAKPPDLRFSPDYTLERLAQLREHLHDPVTADEAAALNDVLCRRREWVVLAAWLKEQTVSWNNYLVSEALRAAEDDRRLDEYLRGEDEKWFKGVPTAAAFLALDCELTPEELVERQVANAEEKAYYLKEAKPCPRCSTPPERLEWFYYCSPPSSWRDVSMGWRTRCLSCVQEVDSFEGMTVHFARPTLPSENAPCD